VTELHGGLLDQLVLAYVQASVVIASVPLTGAWRF
jgi:hypothetical protein